MPTSYFGSHCDLSDNVVVKQLQMIKAGAVSWPCMGHTLQVSAGISPSGHQITVASPGIDHCIHHPSQTECALLDVLLSLDFGEPRFLGFQLPFCLCMLHRDDLEDTSVLENAAAFFGSQALKPF
jgi:hypothetical protein